MKLSSFIAGVAVGSVVSVVVCKKFCGKCHSQKMKDELEQASSTIDSLRNSIDSFTKQLGERITSEQTYAARCEELDAKVQAQAAEIENLKNICVVQDAQNKKLGSV